MLPPAPPAPSSPAPAAQQLWYIGVLFMMGSTFCGALGSLYMKKAEQLRAKAKAGRYSLPASEWRRLRRARWCYFLLGAPVLQIALNTGLSTASFAFASQSLLSPLIAAQIVWTALLSPCIIGEWPTRYDLAGTILIVAGCALSGFFAPKFDQHYSLDALIADYAHPPFDAFLAATAGYLALAYAGARAPRLGAAPRRFCASTLPGALIGLMNVFAKSFSGARSRSISPDSPHRLTWGLHLRPRQACSPRPSCTATPPSSRAPSRTSSSSPRPRWRLPRSTFSTRRWAATRRCTSSLSTSPLCAATGPRGWITALQP